MDNIFVIYNLNENIIILAIAYLRIAPVFFFLPFLNSKLLNSNIIKNLLIVFISIGLWPVFSGKYARIFEIGLIETILYELSIGLVLAFLICFPFFVANIIGELVDNQRGATISDTLDPANGVESSQLSSLFGYIFCMIFLIDGGMIRLVEIFYESYRSLPFVGGLHGFEPVSIGNWLNGLILKSIVIAAPMLVVLFISEIALGLYSRFCPQVNAFSLSLTIKSMIAFSVFLIYFFKRLPDEVVNMIDLFYLFDIFNVEYINYKEVMGF